MAIKMTNNAASTLAGNVSSGATSFTVVSGSTFPSLSSGDHTYVTIGTEVIKVTAISSANFTCIATGAAHSAGDTVELRVTAELLNDFSTDEESLPKSGGTMTGNIAHAGDFKIDTGGDILLDADGADIRFQDGGTDFIKFTKSGNNVLIKSQVADGDIVFKGSDNGVDITALTFDMSEAGYATFNNWLKVNDRVVGNSNLVLNTSDGNEKIQLDASGFIQFEAGGSEAMRIDTNNNLLKGHTATIAQEVCQSGTNVSVYTPDVQINNSGNGGLAVSRFNTGNTESANLWLTKSGSNTIGTQAALAQDEAIGRIIFSASDGSTFSNGASIEAFADAGQGTNDTPARLEFKTTADGATTPTTRMTIKHNGNVGIGVAAPDSALAVTRSENTVFDASQADHQRDKGATLRVQNNSTTSNSFAQILFRNQASNVGGCRIVSVNRGNDQSDLAIVTGDTNEAMRIFANGNAAIGTTDGSTAN